MWIGSKIYAASQPYHGDILIKGDDIETRLPKSFKRIVKLFSGHHRKENQLPYLNN